MIYIPLVIGMAIANFSFHFFTKEKDYGKAAEITLHQVFAVIAVWFASSQYWVAFVGWIDNLLKGCP